MNNYIVHAKKELNENKHESAASLFLEVVKICTSCCIKTDPDLSEAYFNYGRSLYQAGSYEKASFFLETSLFLQENHTKPKPGDKEIEKTQKALKECVEKLEKPSTNSLTATLT